MGSFNTTWFISQQTISTDDSAVIFPISQQKTYRPIELSITQNGKTEQKSRYGYANSTCYPTAFWSFEEPRFTGKYYDYGQFNLDTTPQNTLNPCISYAIATPSASLWVNLHSVTICLFHRFHFLFHDNTCCFIDEHVLLYHTLTKYW